MFFVFFFWAAFSLEQGTLWKYFLETDVETQELMKSHFIYKDTAMKRKKKKHKQTYYNPWETNSFATKNSFYWIAHCQNT